MCFVRACVCVHVCLYVDTTVTAGGHLLDCKIGVHACTLGCREFLKGTVST